MLVQSTRRSDRPPKDQDNADNILVLSFRNQPLSMMFLLSSVQIPHYLHLSRSRMASIKDYKT